MTDEAMIPPGRAERGEAMVDDEAWDTDDWDDYAEDLWDDEDDPDQGDLELAERHSLRRVPGLSTELADISEVEYRQLRLERVVLVSVWTRGSQTDAGMCGYPASAR